MPEPLPLLYWDACVFLSYINGTPEHLRDIDPLLERSGQDFQIITSAITIVEVSFGKIEQDGKVLDPIIEEKIDALWCPGSPVKLVEFHSGIAVKAKEIIRAGLSAGWQLRPNDAIHLATAKLISAQEFHTYDGDLLRYSPLLGIKIGPPLASQLTLITPKPAN